MMCDASASEQGSQGRHEGIIADGGEGGVEVRLKVCSASLGCWRES